MQDGNSAHDYATTKEIRDVLDDVDRIALEVCPQLFDSPLSIVPNYSYDINDAASKCACGCGHQMGTIEGHCIIDIVRIIRHNRKG